MSGNNHLVLALSAWLGLSCQPAPEPPLASVDGIPILRTHFRQRYQQFLRTTHLDDNLQYRHLLAQSLIDEQLLLQHGRKNGLLQEGQIARRRDAAEKQLLLNTLYAREIEAFTAPSEPELQQLFQWSRTSLHVRHLFARERNRIEEVYRRLQAGADWDSLARNLFQDPVLAQSGGDLGFIKLGEFDPPFETAAFSLAPGEISAPVQTSYGYSIIQVVESESDPFLLEEDFQRQRKWLQITGRQYRKYSLIRGYSEAVRQELQPSFDPEGLRLLFRHLPEGTGIPNEPAFAGHNRACLHIGSRGETWNVAQARNRLQTLSGRQRALIRSPEALQEVLTGLAVREQLLQRARDSGIPATEEFQRELQNLEDNLVIRGVLEGLFSAPPRSAGSAARPDQRETYFRFRDSLRAQARIQLDSTALQMLAL